MSKSIPSFAQADVQYTDLFGDDDLMLVDLAIDATPISQTALVPAKIESLGSNRKRLLCRTGSPISTLVTRSSKKTKVTHPPPVP